MSAYKATYRQHIIA